MSKTKRSTTLLLALFVGASSFTLLNSVRAASDPLDLVTICFRNKTILVPLYLLPRYQGVPGTTVGPCISSP